MSRRAGRIQPHQEWAGAPPGGRFIVSILGALGPGPPGGGGLSRGGPLPFMVVGSQLGLRELVPAAVVLPATDPLVAGGACGPGVVLCSAL